MLVSYFNKFIFLRPSFCGSTSTEFVLSKYCKSKEDIITPISFPEEIKRKGQKIYPKNYASARFYEKIYNLSVLLKNKRISDFFLIKNQTLLLKNHDNLEKLLKFRDIDISNFKIISINRHPYEKALSLAKWKVIKKQYFKERTKTTPTKDEILYSLDKVYNNQQLRHINNWPIYTYNNKYIVDLMIEYKNLNNIDKTLGKHFSFGRFKLPQLKKYYDEKYITPLMIPKKIKKYISEICFEEFEKFSYREY